MSSRAFFCYDAEDVASQRVELVRQHWLTGEGCEDAGIFDGEDLRGFTISGDAAVKQMIEGNLAHTTVTCVLIGTHTWTRRWVRYAIVESIQRGNRLLGLHINGIPDRARRTLPLGRNPFDYLAFSFPEDGSSIKVLQYSRGDWEPFPDNPGWPLSKPAAGSRRGRSPQLSSIYKTYDWAKDGGPENLHRWLGA